MKSYLERVYHSVLFCFFIFMFQYVYFIGKFDSIFDNEVTFIAIIFALFFNGILLSFSYSTENLKKIIQYRIKKIIMIWFVLMFIYVLFTIIQNLNDEITNDYIIKTINDYLFGFDEYDIYFLSAHFDSVGLIKYVYSIFWSFFIFYILITNEYIKSSVKFFFILAILIIGILLNIYLLNRLPFQVGKGFIFTSVLYIGYLIGYHIKIVFLNNKEIFLKNDNKIINVLSKVEILIPYFYIFIVIFDLFYRNYA